MLINEKKAIELVKKQYPNYYLLGISQNRKYFFLAVQEKDPNHEMPFNRSFSVAVKKDTGELGFTNEKADRGTFKELEKIPDEERLWFIKQGHF